MLCILYDFKVQSITAEKKTSKNRNDDQSKGPNESSVLMCLCKRERVDENEKKSNCSNDGSKREFVHENSHQLLFITGNIRFISFVLLPLTIITVINRVLCSV